MSMLTDRLGGSRAGVDTKIDKNPKGLFDVYYKNYGDGKDFWKIAQNDLPTYNDAYQAAREIELSLWDADRRNKSQEFERNRLAGSGIAGGLLGALSNLFKSS